MFQAGAWADGQRFRGQAVTVLGVGADGSSARLTRGRYVESIEQLEALAGVLWPEESGPARSLGAPPLALLRRVVADAVASDVLGQELGTPRPVRLVGRLPSPLARGLPEDFELFGAREAFIDEETNVSDADPDPTVRFTLGEATLNGTPDISLRVGPDTIGAVVFAADSAIVPFPSGVQEIEIRYLPDPGFQVAERDEARQRVEMRVARRPQQVLVWRAYFGTNTAVVDGFSRLGRWGWHRIRRFSV